jgi:aminopeptidase N
MRTDTPQPIHLSDYRAPDFLVGEVSLDFDLSPTATRVRAALAVRRNGEHDRPLKFNGERLKLISVAIDGRALPRSS